MPTPSIQTLRNDAQQVLNLDSISAVRSVVAATLANANAGTPLNPNLTTQQLWNEFYQIVTQPKSDIESIIANQLMKFMYAPPAPGGVGANGQVIFNDGGVLAGDAGLTYNKTTDALTITGDLTVDTNVLAVNATTNAVGIGTTVAPAYSSKLRVEGGVEIHTSQALNVQPGNTNPYEIVNRSAGGFAFYPTGSALGMTLDASGNLSLPNGNLILGTSGKGIDFSATANSGGTMTSELLNDYEEGTFVPIVIGSTTAGVGTYTNQKGFYTKVGRIVTVNVWLQWTAHTGTGNMSFSGLPFTIQNIAGNYGGVSIGYVSNIALTAGNVLYGLTEYGTQNITASQTPVGGGTYTLVAVDTSAEIAFTATYMV